MSPGPIRSNLIIDQLPHDFPAGNSGTPVLSPRDPICDQERIKSGLGRVHGHDMLFPACIPQRSGELKHSSCFVGTAGHGQQNWRAANRTAGALAANARTRIPDEYYQGVEVHAFTWSNLCMTDGYCLFPPAPYHSRLPALCSEQQWDADQGAGTHDQQPDKNQNSKEQLHTWRNCLADHRRRPVASRDQQQQSAQGEPEQPSGSKQQQQQQQHQPQRKIEGRLSSDTTVGPIDRRVAVLENDSSACGPVGARPAVQGSSCCKGQPGMYEASQWKADAANAIRSDSSRGLQKHRQLALEDEHLLQPCQQKARPSPMTSSQVHDLVQQYRSPAGGVGAGRKGLSHRQRYRRKLWAIEAARSAELGKQDVIAGQELEMVHEPCVRASEAADECTSGEGTSFIHQQDHRQCNRHTAAANNQEQQQQQTCACCSHSTAASKNASENASMAAGGPRFCHWQPPIVQCANLCMLWQLPVDLYDDHRPAAADAAGTRCRDVPGTVGNSPWHSVWAATCSSSTRGSRSWAYWWDSSSTGPLHGYGCGSAECGNIRMDAWEDVDRSLDDYLTQLLDL